MPEGESSIKKYKLVVMEQSWDVKYSIGNTVNNILITMYGVMKVQDLLRWSLSKLCNVWSLGYIPETNVILYVNCNWKIKKERIIHFWLELGCGFLRGVLPGNLCLPSLSNTVFPQSGCKEMSPSWGKTTGGQTSTWPQPSGNTPAFPAFLWTFLLAFLLSMTRDPIGRCALYLPYHMASDPSTTIATRGQIGQRQTKPICRKFIFFSFKKKFLF